MLLNLKKIDVSERKAKDYAERMSNWDKFHADVVKTQPSAEVLAEMLSVEVSTRRRLRFATRLLGMYQAAAREENARHVATLIAGKR